MSKLYEYFNFLSERIADENYLSDITYALLKSDSDFLTTLFEYCFGVKNKDIGVLEREYTINKSRPDFYFNDGKKDYILEIKIYNKNIHTEYKVIFKDAKRSFIANYDARGKPYYAENIYHVVNTWYDFIPYLEKKKESIKDNELINGYLVYLKKVTQYVEAKSMNLQKTTSLYDFNIILEKIVKKFPGNILSVNNSKKSAFGAEFYGKYIKCKKQRKRIQFWIGVYFEDSSKLPFVCIEDYGKLKVKSKGKYYFETECIYLNDDLNKKLNDSKEKIKDQEEILYNFINEIIEQV